MKKEEMVKHINRSFISKKLTFCSHDNNSVTIQELGWKHNSKECKFLQLTFLKLESSQINDIKTRLESSEKEN